MPLVISALACLPHVRGGVSSQDRDRMPRHMSSPRPWGCFRKRRRHIARHAVFPTSVGVFLRRITPLKHQWSLPHVRGGVSDGRECWTVEEGSSPRPWGCFYRAGQHHRRAVVFPTSVGVFLVLPLRTSPSRCLRLTWQTYAAARRGKKSTRPGVWKPWSYCGG